MTIVALDIITDAYERCNRLSPGEVLGDDDIARGFRRLNLLVDELSAQNLFLFKATLTSAAQTGHITLGAGSWTAIDPGDVIVSATADARPISPLSMQQYNYITDPTTTGVPMYFAQDGFSTVYLYPVATGQTIKLQTQTGVSQFADINTTTYTVPAGWQSALGAALAVRIAPAIIGRVTPDLLKAEKECMGNVDGYTPAIVDAAPFNRTTGSRQTLRSWP